MNDAPSPTDIAHQLRQPTGELGLQVAERMNASNLKQNEAAFDALELDTATHLLEVGMGNGGLVADLLGQYPGLRYFGADFSADMVAEAGRRNAALAHRATFVQASVDALPFADDAFDRILTVNTLYFWPDARRGLAELYRVLAPGGRLVMSIRTAQTMRAYPFTSEVFTLYERKELEDLFMDSPFGRPTITEHDDGLRIAASGLEGPSAYFVAVAEK